jgi:thiosulfate dehydrogenase (quinone) large subunit
MTPAVSSDDKAIGSTGPQRAAPPLTRRAGPAWVLLPLRLFLGVTFIDAGVGKLLSADYFGEGQHGFATLARGFAEGSPLAAPIRSIVLEHPFASALVVAVLELVVGLLTVLGLASRLAAGAGLALSIVFFLTATWRVRPFFYGADLPFAVGWLTLLLAGHGGLPSVDATLVRRQRAELGVGPADLVAVPLNRVQQHCMRTNGEAGCPSAMGDTCRGGGCPLLGGPPSAAARDADRRAFLASAGKAASVAVGAFVMALGAAPMLGRRTGGELTGRRRRIASLGSLPVGQALDFQVPSTGNPGLVVRLTRDRVVAYDAICTHARCIVQFDPDRVLLVCYCHQAEFDPRRHAAVLAGPAPRPLPSLKVTVAGDGAIFVEE